MAVHRYWRLNATVLTSGGDWWVPGKVEMRGTIGGANLIAIGSGTATSNYTQVGTPADAFDTDPATLWYGYHTGPAWLQWDFGAAAPQDVQVLTIVANASFGSQVKVGNLSYSDNNTDWTVFIDIPERTWSPAQESWYAPGNNRAILTAPQATLYASGGCGYANLSGPMQTALGYGGANAALLAPRATITTFGGATAVLTGTFPTLSADGHDSTGENAADITAPSPTLTAHFGGTARLTAPRPVLSASATFTGIGEANLTAPQGTLQASGTTGGAASASLRAPVGKLVGYSGAVASLTTKNSPTLVASGTAGGIGSAALKSPMATLVGYSGAVCSITLTGGASLQASGTAGSIGRAQLTCPLFELTASGTVNGLSSANLIAPSPRLTGTSSVAYLIAPAGVLTAIGTAVVAVTYEAYSVNLKHKVRTQGDQPAVDEVTRYTNFPFTHIVRYQNSYFGVAADGLYLLEGTTDNGAPIAYAVKTAVDDFNVSNKKILSSAYLSGRIGPTMTVTLHAGETGQNAYPYSTPRGQGAQNHREKFGKGVKDRYFALGLSGTDVLEIDNIELEDNKLSRRI